MSQTFELVCHETKQSLWIGQGRGGSMTTFYSDEKRTMEHLGRFLEATRGKSLVLMEGEELCNLVDEYEDFREVSP